MNVLAFDPSSSATGYALMQMSGVIEPIEVGVIRRPEQWPAYLRLRCLRREVSRLIARLEGRFSRVVVEVPGTAQAGRKRGVYATSGSYAAAVGIVLGEAWETGVPVISVASDWWTRSRGKGQAKDRRLRTLELATSYERSEDKGGDAGDAIMLGAWYARHHGLERDESCVLHLPAAKLGSLGRYAADAIEADPNGDPRPMGSRWGS